MTLCTAARGDYDCVVTFDLGPDAIDPDFALPLLHTEELVSVLMDFLPNFFTRLQRHYHNLKMLARLMDPPIIVVFFGKILDVFNEYFHYDLLWWIVSG